jgi:hypothetical protein
MEWMWSPEPGAKKGVLVYSFCPLELFLVCNVAAFIMRATTPLGPNQTSMKAMNAVPTLRHVPVVVWAGR